MTSIRLTETLMELETIRTAKLTNEQILELMSQFTEAEYIEPYAEHLRLLREKYDMSIEVRSLELEVFSMRDKFNIAKLRKLFEAFGDHGYHTLISDLMTTYQHDNEAVVYAQALERIFNYSPDYEFTKDLIRVLRDSEMEGSGVDSLLRYYQNQLDRVSPYAEIPKYIREYNIDPLKLPQVPEPQITADVSKGLAAEIISSQLDSYGFYIGGDEEDNTEYLAEQLEAMDPEEYSKFIESIKVDPEEIARIRADKNIFRVYGPANPYPDTDYSQLVDENGQSDANIVYGGARMFVDNTQEYDYDNDLPQENWFTGHCLQCSLKIRTYFHAVRLPHLIGGWSGCYCSWKCVLDYIYADFDDETSDEYNKYILHVAIVRAMDDLMNEIGIADREYDEDES